VGGGYALRTFQIFLTAPNLKFQLLSNDAT